MEGQSSPALRPRNDGKLAQTSHADPGSRVCYLPESSDTFERAPSVVAIIDMKYVWVVVPDILDLPDYKGAEFRDGALQWQLTPELTIVCTAMHAEHSTGMVHTLETFYRKLPRIDLIFFLGTCAAPDWPVELNGGYDQEVLLKIGQQFAVNSSFSLPSADGWACLNGSAPVWPLRGLDMGQARSFSSDAPITKELFQAARRSNYLCCLGDRWSSSFYYSLYQLEVTNNHLALLAIDRYAGAEADSEQTAKCMRQLWESLILWLKSSALSHCSRAVKQQHPSGGTSEEVEALRHLVQQKEEEKQEVQREHMDILVSITEQRKAQARQAQEDPMICKMCYEREINTFCEPCGHAVICSVCSDKLASNPALMSSNHCVSCRTEIRRVHKFILQ